MIDIGFLLEMLRKEHDYTQKQVAKELAIDESTLARWENNYRIPNIKNLIMLADFYNVPLDYFTSIGTVQVVTVDGLSAQDQELFANLVSVLNDPSQKGLTPYKLELLGRLSSLLANTQ